jgi:hypothetical protein
MNRTLRTVGIAGATSVVLIASLAHAANPPATRTLDVEITDSVKGATETTQFHFALDGTRSTKLSMASGDYGYLIESRLDAPASGAQPVGLKLVRSDKRTGSPGRMEIDLSVAVPVGARTIVANATRPDGSRVEIAVRVH